MESLNSQTFQRRKWIAQSIYAFNVSLTEWIMTCLDDENGKDLAATYTHKPHRPDWEKMVHYPEWFNSGTRAWTWSCAVWFQR